MEKVTADLIADILDPLRVSVGGSRNGRARAKMPHRWDPGDVLVLREFWRVQGEHQRIPPAGFALLDDLSDDHRGKATYWRIAAEGDDAGFDLYGTNQVMLNWSLISLPTAVAAWLNLPPDRPRNRP